MGIGLQAMSTMTRGGLRGVIFRRISTWPREGIRCDARVEPQQSHGKSSHTPRNPTKRDANTYTSIDPPNSSHEQLALADV
eukprot:9468434-Pyramimonas_sp.AAC.1